YFEAPKVRGLDRARRFALHSLDRVLSEGWQSESALRHVIAYSDVHAGGRVIPGVLDDYAVISLACLDAYEATGDLSYFKFANRIADAMLEKFFDQVSGGLFDTEQTV